MIYDKFMNFFKRFAVQIAHSVYSPAFYGELSSKPFSYSLKYLVSLSLLFSVVVSVWYGVIIGIDLWRFITVTGPAEVQEILPDDLVLTIANGNLSINQPEPYIAPLPVDLRNESSSSSPKNLIVIDTNTPASIDAFRSYDTYILADKHTIIVQKSEQQTQSVTLPNDLDLVISSTTAASLNQTIQEFIDSWKWLIILGTLFLMVTIIFVFGLVGHLLYLLIAALGVMLISRLKGKPLGYAMSYQTGMHLITLPIALSLIILLLGSSLPPFVFSFVLSLFALLNIRRVKADSTIPTAPLAGE
jgi:hypothetical protein